MAGPDSFAGEQFVVAGPTTTLKIPNPQVTLPPLVTTTTAPATSTTHAARCDDRQPPPRPPTVLVAYPGDTPALYGGSKDKLIADKEGELASSRATRRRPPPSAKPSTATPRCAGAEATRC